MPNLTELVYKEGKINGKGKVMKKSIVKVVLSTALLTSVGFGSELVLSGTKVDFEKKLSLHQLASTSIDQKDILTVISTKKSLGDEEKDKLFSLGAKSIKYAANDSYYVLVDRDKIDDILDYKEVVSGIAVLKPEHKIDKELKNISINKKIRVKVSFLENLSSDAVKDLLNKQGIEYKKLNYDEELNLLEVTIDGFDIENIALIPSVKRVSKYHDISLIKPFSKKIAPLDMAIARDTNTNDVWSLDPDLDGLNVPVGLVDEGEVLKTHQEFTLGGATRIRDRVDASVSTHTTHVAGILGAEGKNYDAKGMASSIQIFNYTYNSISFASALKLLADNDILLSNHSYGFDDMSDLGRYNIDAENEDSMIERNPYINMFIAAGNDRTREGYPDIMIIKGAANAKNVFTIGALDYSSSDVAYYSSVGPAIDGRIKPDLVVKGSSVYSTSSADTKDYSYMTGTSMATPAATGIAALVMQEYKNLTNCGHNRGCDMRADVLKAVLVNTAIDKNKPGPDIYTGYGMINAKEAIETVKTLDYLAEYDGKQKIKLDKVSKGSKKEYPFSLNEKKDFKVTVSWIDPAGNSASGGKALVNDLDIYLENKDTGDKYYPYSLDTGSPQNIAYHDRKNSVDNTEKVEVKDLPEGDYVLVVDASNIQTSSQEYAIASSELMFSKSASSINSNPRVKLEVNNFAKVMLESIY